MSTKVVSYSEVDAYRQCRLKHQLAYKEMWDSKETAPALSRGTLFHAVMEAHYKLLKMYQEVKRMGAPMPEDLFLAIAPLLYEEGTGRQTEEQQLVEWMYRGYVDQYKLDPQWVIVDVERRVELWLPTERGTRSTFKLAGTIDLLVKDMSAGGGLWLVDHKTCRNLPRQKDFDMEDQTGIYTYLMRQSGLNIRGAIYNHVRTEKLKREMTPEERFKRTLTVRTEQELRTMALEALDTMREAYRPRKWATGDPPRTPDGERCGWKCSFTEPCLAGRKSGPQKLRDMLEDIGFCRSDTKPGPTFNKDRT